MICVLAGVVAQAFEAGRASKARSSRAENNLAIRFRDGLHGTMANDIEEYIDFFDYVFKRTNRKPENKLLYNYTFENWRKLSKEEINLLINDIRKWSGANDFHLLKIFIANKTFNILTNLLNTLSSMTIKNLEALKILVYSFESYSCYTTYEYGQFEEFF